MLIDSCHLSILENCLGLIEQPLDNETTHPNGNSTRHAQLTIYLCNLLEIVLEK